MARGNPADRMDRKPLCDAEPQGSASWTPQSHSNIDSAESLPAGLKLSREVEVAPCGVSWVFARKPRRSERYRARSKWRKQEGLVELVVCLSHSDQKFPAKGRGAQRPKFPRNFGPWAAQGRRGREQAQGALARTLRAHRVVVRGVVHTSTNLIIA